MYPNIPISVNQYPKFRAKIIPIPLFFPFKIFWMPLAGSTFLTYYIILKAHHEPITYLRDLWSTVNLNALPLLTYHPSQNNKKNSSDMVKLSLMAEVSSSQN